MGKLQRLRLGAFVAMGLLCGMLAVASGASRGLQVVDGESGKSLKLYQGGSYALVIGVSDYKNGWPALAGVKKDITRIKTALEEQGFKVTVVESPTKAALNEAMDKFRKNYGLEAENRLLFYYAGHGHTMKTLAGPMGYIVPADAPNPNRDEKGFLSTAIDMEEIEGYAKRLQTKHALFLFDSCFSGSLFSLSREAPPKHITEKTSQPVRQFITAGDADEPVPDQSIFAEQFLAALQGEADTNSDGYLTGTELGEFLKEKVINYSGSSQHPQYGKIRNPNLDKGDFVFQVTITVKGSSSGTKVEITSGPSDMEQRLSALERQKQQGGGGSDPESEAWNGVKDSNHSDDFRSFLQEYPSGKYAKNARIKLQQLERQAALPPPSATPAPSRPPRQESLPPPASPAPSAKPLAPPKSPPPPASAGPATFTNSIGIEFVRIPAGDFLMGSSDGAPDQKPLHKVTISRPFYLGKYEVTQAQWMEVMGSNPSYYKEDRQAGGGADVGKEIGGFFKRIVGKEEKKEQERSASQEPENILDRPVERVSWMQARDFILKLNQREGHEKYRLPTEAEWEYAARAGSTGVYGEGNDERELGDHAWYHPNAGNTTHPVGQRRPNAWGLYDIQGNVLEWVWDKWAPNYSSATSTDPQGPTTGTLQVLRGCAWPYPALHCRLAHRIPESPIVAKHFYGFRLVRELP